MPADMGSLVKAVLRKLESHELNAHIAHAPFVGSEQHPVLSDPETTAAYLHRQLDDWYPEGLDESTEQMTSRLARALQAQALEEGIEQKKFSLSTVPTDAFVLVDSVWKVTGSEEEPALRLRRWERPPYFDGEPAPAPHPA